MKSTLFLRFVVLHTLLFTFFRWVFYLFFRPEEFLQTDVLQKAFILGARFDLRLTCILLIPLIFFSWWRWNLKSAKIIRRWSLFYVFLSVVWMTFYVFDFGFYDYLDGRMNSSALLFLENPDISFGMLWQSYPVVWILIGFFAFIAFYAHLLNRFVFRLQKKNFLSLPSFINLVVFVLVFLVGLYGQVSQYPLRWSEAFFSPHHFISHLTLNPVLYFFESYEFSNNKQFDEKKVRELYPVFADYLGVKDKNQEALQWTREVRGQAVQNPPNVVVIVMESLSYSKTNLGENPLKPTPEIEKVAAESLVFSNYFSSSEGTARNMFSIMTAIPDVTKVQTSTRNPLVVDQRLIANAYKNYRKMYFVGGSASWANIRGIFSHNIEGIEIYEEGSFDKSKTDVWGVSDLDLFIEAHEKFVKLPKQQPFFAVIQAASFHRPYTIPANPLDFKTVDVPTTTLKEAGFYSLEQLNSLRFSDYSLGHFLKLAKKSSYYQNTLFVITGDHGLPDDGGVNVPKGIHFWELEKYHVPLILHNARLFPKASVESKMAGHMDVMTSVASVAGTDHFNTTLGRNLFDSEFDKERYSFIYNYYSELNEYGLLSEQFYLRRNDKNGHQLFAYRSDTPEVDVKDQNKETFARMKTISDGYYQTAKYLLFHNQKKAQKKGADRNQPQK